MTAGVAAVAAEEDAAEMIPREHAFALSLAVSASPAAACAAAASLLLLSSTLAASAQA